MAGRALFAAVVAVAALNRETGGMLAVWYLLLWWRFDRTQAGLAWGVLYAALWGGLIWLVRIAAGPGPWRWTIQATLAHNAAQLGESVVAVVVLLGGWWLLAWRGWKRAEGFIRAIAPGLLLYGGAWLLLSQWRETRTLALTLPVLIAMALSIEKRGGDRDRP